MVRMTTEPKSKRTKNRKMKKLVKKRLILLLVACAILISLILYFITSTHYSPNPEVFANEMDFYNHSDIFFNYEIWRYHSNVTVSELTMQNESVTLGVVVDPWNLNFGIIPSGNNSGARVIEFDNMKENPAKVYVEVYGNLTPHVETSNNNFIIQPKENVVIDLIFEARNAAPGNYEGEIDVIIQKPKYSFIYSLWR